MSKLGSNYICLEIILSDFVLIKDENYYAQVFWKECKYIERENKVVRYITDDLEFVLMILIKKVLIKKIKKA